MNAIATHNSLICIPVREGYEVVRPSDITYIESRDDICRIYRLNASKNYIVCVRINELADCLPRQLFCRIHRGYIVSISHIVAINRHRTRVCITGDTWLPVGRVYQPELTEKFYFLR